MIFRATLVASSLVLIVAPRAARAQSHDEPDPAAAVRSVTGPGHAVLNQSVRHAGGAHIWTYALRTRPGACYLIVSAARGPGHVITEVHSRPPHEDDARSVVSSHEPTTTSRFCTPATASTHSLGVQTDGPTRFAVTVMLDTRPYAAAAPVADTPVAPRAVPAAPSRPEAVVPVGGSENDFPGNQLRAYASEHHVARAIVPAVRAQLTTNQSRELSLPLEAGRCIDAVAAGVPSVQDLDLELSDPAGNRVAQDTGHRALETVHYCATYAGSYRLTVRMFNGFGLTAVQAFETAR